MQRELLEHRCSAIMTQAHLEEATIATIWFWSAAEGHDLFYPDFAPKRVHFAVLGISGFYLAVATAPMSPPSRLCIVC